MITVLAVHAHPDDEAIWTGIALARANALSAKTRVVTCTLGEEGEVIGEDKARLLTPAQHPEGTGLLGGYRLAELQRSLRGLELKQEPMLLGGIGRWRDSGMLGSAAFEQERAFANPRNLEAQVQDMLTVFAELRPDIVLTYAPDGGYGHPDHVRAHVLVHEATRRAPQELKPKQILWCVTEHERIAAGLQEVEDWEIPAGWARGVPEVMSAEVFEAAMSQNQNAAQNQNTAQSYTAAQNHATAQGNDAVENTESAQVAERAAVQQGDSEQACDKTQQYCDYLRACIAEYDSAQGDAAQNTTAQGNIAQRNTVHSSSQRSAAQITAVPGHIVDITLEATATERAAQRAAMRAHATQLTISEPVFALSNVVAQPLASTESYIIGYTSLGIDRDYARNFFTARPPQATQTQPTTDLRKRQL